MRQRASIWSTRLSGVLLIVALLALWEFSARVLVHSASWPPFTDVLRTLVARGYVTEVGQDPGPGRATLYGTTGPFLERLGLDSLHDLPPLADFVPAPEVVEALERGLHVERDAAAIEPHDGDASADGAQARGEARGETVDLTVVDVTDDE